jgi:hypothetical protein
VPRTNDTLPARRGRLAVELTARMVLLVDDCPATTARLGVRGSDVMPVTLGQT